MMWSDAFITCLFFGCSAIHQIRVLSLELLLDWEEESCQAFALMLCRLENLEELSQLYSPPENMWSHVHRMGGHSKLQSFSICDLHVTETDLEATVRAIVRDFPALVTLKLEFREHDCITLDRTAEILSGLKCHSSMRNLRIAAHYTNDNNEVHDCLRMLQKNLGSQCSVTDFHPDAYVEFNALGLHQNR
jgi:hypothetical protein